MGYYFIVVGTVIALFAVWSVFRVLRLFLVGEHARGRIVGFDQKLRTVGSRKRVYYHAQIEFVTAAGERVTFTFGYGSTTRKGEIGQDVPVIYDAAVPEKVVVNSFMGIWAGLLAVTILAGGCLFAGIQIINEQ